MNTKIWKSACMLLMLGIAGCSTPITGTDTASDDQPAKPPQRMIRILLSHASFPFAAKATDIEKDKYIQELSRLSGYRLQYEFLGHNVDFEQQLWLRFASGELADLIRTVSIDSGIHRGAVNQGVFLELGPLLDKYGPNIKKRIPEQAWKSPRVTKDGKIYGIPVLTGTPAERVVFVRQDWLDRLQMKAPETLEEFLKFAEEVKRRDMNGDGDPDNEYALSLTDNLAWNDIFSSSFGVRPGVWNMRGEQLEPDIIQPQMKEVIRFYKTLYENGYVQRDFVTRTQEDRKEDIAQGLLGMWGAAAYQYNGAFDRTSARRTFVGEPNASVSMIAPPKGPNGDMGLSVENDQIYFVWVIPSKTKHPEEVIKFLDWAWSSPEADKFFAYGVKGVNYTENNGSIRFDVNLPANADNSQFQFFQISLNVRENGLNNPLVLKTLPENETILRGYELAKCTLVKNESMYMPRLKALEGRADLNPALSSGSLFYRAFVKLVTGKEDVDAGFDAAVKEWRRLGGDLAIQEATEWYRGFYGGSRR